MHGKVDTTSHSLKTASNEFRKHVTEEMRLGTECSNYFSGFSVGFCINEEKVTCYQLELGK